MKAISIGELAFTGCNAVTDIFCGAPAFNDWEDADVDFNKNAVLHVKSADLSEWNDKWGGSSKSRVTIRGDLNDYTGYGTPDPIGASYDSELKKLTITMSVKELPNNAANTISVMKTYKDEVETVEFQLACNAYISDPLPNYSAYCAKLYPTYTKHLNLKRTRGIFQTDYCGMNEFTRLELSQVIAIVTAKVLISGVLDDPVTLIAIAGAFEARTPDKVMSHTLISSMIYNNFRYFR